jgi:cytochrome c oxidase subunit 2
MILRIFVHTFRRLLAPFTLFSLMPLFTFAQENLLHVDPKSMVFQEAVTPVMERLTGMHHNLLILITVITIFVLALLIYVCIRFSAKNNPVPSKTTHNVTVEVVWTVIPILILLVIAVPSLRLHYFMEDIPKADITLKAQGHQWYWGYTYPDQGITFESRMLSDEDLKNHSKPVRLLTTDNPVVVPVNKVVRVEVTGADVIHAWAMPAFGVKTDAIPGRLNETWFKATKEGIYYGQCSELCGVDHGFMPIEVHVVSQEKYDAWVAEAKVKFGALENQGKPEQILAINQ